MANPIVEGNQLLVDELKEMIAETSVSMIKNLIQNALIKPLEKALTLKNQLMIGNALIINRLPRLLFTKKTTVHLIEKTVHLERTIDHLKKMMGLKEKTNHIKSQNIKR